MPELRPRTLVDKVRHARTIQLDIPSDTSSARYWGPHQFAPSVKLGRVDQVPFCELPRLAPEDIAAIPDVKLVLTKRFGTHRFVDVHAASLRGPSGEMQSGLVVKVLDLSLFPPSGDIYPHRQFAEEIVSQEFDIVNLLASLQGTVVPRFAGLFTRGTLYCMVYEDAGRLLTPEEKWSKPVGDEIIVAVKAVHAAGVATARMEWDTICRGNDGHIKFTHFKNDSTMATIPRELQELRERDGYDSWPDLTPEELMKSRYKNGIVLTNELLGRA